MSLGVMGRNLSQLWLLGGPASSGRCPRAHWLPRVLARNVLHNIKSRCRRFCCWLHSVVAAPPKYDDEAVPADMHLQQYQDPYDTAAGQSRTTLPRCLRTRSGISRTASLMEQNTTPALLSSSLKVVAMDTESKTASMATFFTFASRFCGCGSESKHQHLGVGNTRKYQAETKQAWRGAVPTNPVRLSPHTSQLSGALLTEGRTGGHRGSVHHWVQASTQLLRGG